MKVQTSVTIDVENKVWTEENDVSPSKVLNDALTDLRTKSSLKGNKKNVQ